MNDQTTKLIETLANKLGTTSEYLWGILIRQAPISATIHCIGFFMILLIMLAVYRVHKHAMNDDNKFSYNENGEFIGVPIVISFVICLMVIAAYIVNSPKILAGFYNPEYWALNYILDQLQ